MRGGFLGKAVACVFHLETVAKQAGTCPLLMASHGIHAKPRQPVELGLLDAHSCTNARFAAPGSKRARLAPRGVSAHA